MGNITLNIEGCSQGSETDFFIAQHTQPGRVMDSINMPSTLSTKVILKGLMEALGATESSLTEAGKGFVVGEHGAFSGSVRGTSKYTRFDGYFIAEPAALAKIHDMVAGTLCIPPRVEGVYSINIMHFFLDKRGDTKRVNHHKTNLDFEDLLSDMYPKVDVNMLMKMYGESSENNLILTGPPGTGKTCFVKMCLRAFAMESKKDITAIYVKDREILKKDEFWARLAEMNVDVLVLDDLDDELLPRTEGRNVIVNNMLSFSDGLFDSTTKIIITTNQPNTAIDSALIRPGRCFDILSLPNLSPKEALEVWTGALGNTPESFTEVFGTPKGVISQASLMSEHARYQKVGATPYLRDPSVSIRQKVISSGHTD